MEKQRGATPHTRRRGMLTLEQLRVEVSEGNIDTVVVAFTDMQGRLQGKRLAADFFLDDVVGSVIEGCNYLLAVDVEMNTVDGYAMSSWQTGYGDFVMAPDMSTLRRVPWQEATAMVIADLTWHDGSPVVASPQADPEGPDRPARRAGPAGHGRHRAGVRASTPTPTLPRRPPGTAASPRPTPTTSTTRSWAPPRIEPLLRKLRNGMAGAGLQVESAKGECNLGQHEIAFRYADAVTTCDNHSIYKTGSKEIADAEGMSITFMAKSERPGGQLLPHSPVGP